MYLISEPYICLQGFLMKISSWLLKRLIVWLVYNNFKRDVLKIKYCFEEICKVRHYPIFLENILLKYVGY